MTGSPPSTILNKGLSGFAAAKNMHLIRMVSSDLHSFLPMRIFQNLIYFEIEMNVTTSIAKHLSIVPGNFTPIDYAC